MKPKSHQCPFHQQYERPSHANSCHSHCIFMCGLNKWCMRMLVKSHLGFGTRHLPFFSLTFPPIELMFWFYKAEILFHCGQTIAPISSFIQQQLSRSVFVLQQDRWFELLFWLDGSLTASPLTDWMVDSFMSGDLCSVFIFVFCSVTVSVVSTEQSTLSLIVNKLLCQVESFTGYL